MPGTQPVQTVEETAPTTLDEKPGGHCVQLVAASAVPYVPVGHGAQLAKLLPPVSFLDVPRGQATMLRAVQ